MIDIGHISTRNLHFDNNSSGDSAINEIKCGSNSRQYVLARTEHRVDIFDLDQLDSHEEHNNGINTEKNNNNSNMTLTMMLSVPFPHRRLTSCSLVALPLPKERKHERKHYGHNTTRKTHRNENINKHYLNDDDSKNNDICTHVRRVQSHKPHSSPPINTEVLLAVGDDRSTLRISRHTFMTHKMFNQATSSECTRSTSHRESKPVNIIFIGNSWDGLNANWLRNRQQKVQQCEEEEQEWEEKKKEENQTYLKKNVFCYHNSITTLFPATNDGSIFVCQREWEDYSDSNSSNKTHDTTLSGKTQQTHYTSPVVWVASVETETARRVELQILPPSSPLSESPKEIIITEALTNNYDRVTKSVDLDNSNNYPNKELFHDTCKVKLIDVRCMSYAEWTNDTQWNKEMYLAELRSSLFCKHYNRCTLEKVKEANKSQPRRFVAVYSDWFTLHDSLSCKPLVSFPLKNCKMTQFNGLESSSTTGVTTSTASNLDHQHEWKIIDVFQCQDNDSELQCCHHNNMSSSTLQNKPLQEIHDPQESESKESNNNKTNARNTNNHELIVVFEEQKRHDKIAHAKLTNDKSEKEEEEEEEQVQKHQESMINKLCEAKIDGKGVNDFSDEENWEPRVCIAGYDTRVPTGPVWYSICKANQKYYNYNNKKFSSNNREKFIKSNYHNASGDIDTYSFINSVNVRKGKCQNKLDYTNASNLVESLDPYSLCVVSSKLTRKSVVQTLRVPWCRSQQRVVRPIVLSAQPFFAQEHDTPDKSENTTSDEALKVIRALVNYNNILHVITTNAHEDSKGN